MKLGRRAMALVPTVNDCGDQPVFWMVATWEILNFEHRSRSKTGMRDAAGPRQDLPQLVARIQSLISGLGG